MSSQYWTFLRVDLVVLVRSRFHLWGLASALGLGALLRLLEQQGVLRVPIGVAMGLLVGTSAFFFGGLMIRREQNQGSLGTLSTTPARPRVFLASKTSSLCGLGIVQGVALLIASQSPPPSEPLLLVFGIMGAAALGGLLGIVIATLSWPWRAGLAMLAMCLLLQPVGVLQDAHPSLLFSPFASIALIDGSLSTITTSALVLAFGSCCVSIAGLYAVCERRLECVARRCSAA